MQQNRQLLLRAPAVDNEKVRQQLQMIAADSAGVQERDLIVVQDIKPSYKSFSVTLIGKDGSEKYSAGEPVTMEKLFSLIDAMPMRRQELRKKKAPGGE